MDENIILGRLACAVDKYNRAAAAARAALEAIADTADAEDAEAAQLADLAAEDYARATDDATDALTDLAQLTDLAEAQGFAVTVMPVAVDGTDITS